MSRCLPLLGAHSRWAGLGLFNVVGLVKTRMGPGTE